MDDPSTLMIRRIDDPLMVAFVELDVALVGCFVFFLVGIVFEKHLLGLAAGYFAGRLYHQLKAGKPRGAAKHWTYWYLPSFMTRLRATPPSHHTLMFG